MRKAIRKGVALVGCALMALGFGLAACSGPEDDEPDPAYWLCYEDGCDDANNRAAQAFADTGTSCAQGYDQGYYDCTETE